jgi:cyclase
VGGGIRNIEDIRALLNAGADKVSINTQAVRHPELVKKSALRFGSQCIVVAIDAKRIGAKKTKKWRVYINSGTIPTDLDAVNWARKVSRLGAGEILLTSIDCDGTKNGYDIDLIKEVSSNVNIPVIASGGAGTMKHFYQALTSGADAALAASLFHYRELNIRKLKKYLRQKGVVVRL